MAKSLNYQKIQTRMTKSVPTKEALKDVTPFNFGEGKSNRTIKIVVSEGRNQCVKKET